MTAEERAKLIEETLDALDECMDEDHGEEDSYRYLVYDDARKVLEAFAEKLTAPRDDEVGDFEDDDDSPDRPAFFSNIRRVRAIFRGDTVVHRESSAARLYTVTTSDDLQPALDAAQPGDEVVLAAGVRFVGNFVLPPKLGGAPIIIRSSAEVPPFPTHAHIALSPLCTSNNADPFFTLSDGAAWIMRGLAYEQNAHDAVFIQVLCTNADLTLDRWILIAAPEEPKP